MATIIDQVITGTNDCLIGTSIVFNAIVLIVYNRKSLKDLSMSRYLSAVAIFDPFLIASGVFMNHPVLNIASWVCKLLAYIFCVMYQLCTWINCAVSIDRWITIVHPSKFKIKDKFWFQIVVLMAIFIISCGAKVVFIVYFNTFHPTNATTVCDCLDPVDCLYMASSNFFISSVIPFIIMISCTICVFRIVKRSRAKFSKSSNLSRENNMLRTMVATDTFFFVCNAPLLVSAYIGYIMNANVSYLLVFRITTVLIYCHRTFPLLIYLGSNKLFRNEFMRMFKLNRGRYSEEQSKSKHTNTTK